MKDIKLEDCLELHKKFKAYCGRAEQHEFPMLFIIDRMMESTLKKWETDGVDQKEARAMFRLVLKRLGEDCSEYKEEENV